MFASRKEERLSYASQAVEFYNESIRGKTDKKIAPIFVKQLKAAVASGLRKKQKPLLVAKAFLAEKGIVLASAKKEKKDSPPTKTEKASKKSEPVETVNEKKKGEKKKERPKKEEKREQIVMSAPVFEPQQLEIPELRAALTELGLAYSKKDDETKLRLKLNKALAGAAKPEALSKLALIDPGKLKTAGLVQDCIGLYIDMTTPACVACPTKVDCLKQYVTNLGSDFSMFAKAMDLSQSDDQETSDRPKKKKKKDSEAQTATPKKKKKRKLVYDANLTIGVSGKDAEAFSHLYSDMEDEDDAAAVSSLLQRILSDSYPETLGELKEIVDEFFEGQTVKDFVAFALTLAQEKVIVLPK